MRTGAVWAFIDTSVTADGTIHLGAPQTPTTNLRASAEPAAFVEEAVWIVVGTLMAGALGFIVGYDVNDNEAPGSTDDAESDEGEGSEDHDDSGGSEGSGGHDDSGGDTGDDGGAGAGVVATPILSNGSLGTVHVTFRDAAFNDVV
jgi:hypothetical protein